MLERELCSVRVFEKQTMERAPKGAVPQHKVAFARQRQLPLVCTKTRGSKGMFFHKERGRSPSRSKVILATPIRSLILPPMQRIPVCMERCTLHAGLYLRESGSFVERKTKLPTNRRRRDSWGVVSYPNVEKGAIRNRRVRARAPRRHRVRSRPCRLPWRSEARHRRRP